MKFSLLMKQIARGLSANPLNVLYDEAHLDKPLRRGLNWVMGGNMFGTLHGIICGGGTAAMVGLAGALGAGDMEFGLLVALPQIAALMQLPFSMLVNKTQKRKIWLLTIGLFSRLLWMVFGFLPLLGGMEANTMKLYTLISLLGISSICGSVINVCWFPWFSDMCPIRIRGRWLSFRDSILAVGSLLFGLLVAYMLDALPIDSKYIVIFLIGGALGVMDMVCFGFAPEVKPASSKKIQMGKTMLEALRNKPFRQLTIMWTVWNFTANLSGAYLTPYAMNSMGLNFMQITVFGTVAASVATVIIVPRWGRALDQYGARNVMLLGCIGASLTPLFYLISTPGNVLPTLLHNLVGAFFWCGSNLAANSMQLSTSPNESRPTYIAIFSCITALLGAALGTMAGGWLLEWWDGAGWFIGFFDRYKVLILLSVVLRFGFTMLLVPAMEKTSSDNGHLRDVLHMLLPAKRVRY